MHPLITDMKRPSIDSQRSGRGFTLIELMIVVAVIAILSMIAMPSYQEHVRRSKRSEAQGILMEAAQYMQRYYSANDRYTAAAGTTTSETEQTVTSGGSTTSILPGDLQKSPKGAGAANYTISVEARDTPPTYTLKATRTGSMSSDKCGTLTLNSQGVKGLDSAATGLGAVDCWK
mgnify:CR=1 FL=1